MTGWRRPPWVANLARDPATLPPITSVCLTIADPDVLAAGEEAVTKIAKGIVSTLEAEGIGLRYRRLSRCACRPAYLVRRHGGDERSRSAHPLARLGLRAGEGEARAGCVSFFLRFCAFARHPTPPPSPEGRD